jgi:hypothetical protein
MKHDLFSWASIATFALFWLSATLAASAQTVPADHPSTAEKIADALTTLHHEGCDAPRLADYPRRGISRASPRDPSP